MTAAFFTLGCKLNQIETEAITGSFTQSGFLLVPWGKPADIAVLNTCTVTSHAEQKARRQIRLALSRCRFVVVTGCCDPFSDEDLDGERVERLVYVPGARKDLLLDLAETLAGKESAEASRMRQIIRKLLKEPESTPQADERTARSELNRFRFNPPRFLFHSRAFLKIQDGCDRACAYCRVPIARGPGISLESGVILQRLRDLESRGFAEAVLSGVNVCQYSSAGMRFADLLDFLLRGTSRIALRLSSIDPVQALEDGFAVVSDKRIRPHFHLSVQSGSSRVLAAMNRPYTGERIVRAVLRLRSLKQDPFIGCDIIAGFPGETGECFEETKALCRESAFASIHAFPFSRRPGTKAFYLKNSVPERVSRARVGELLQLSRQGRAAYISRWLGKRVEALALKKAQKKPVFFTALTDNYLRVRLCDNPPAGAFLCRLLPVPAEADGIDAGGVFDEKQEINLY
ncbi:MAG: MiaB/RimO family radical SAM methylthiotransferase [Treponema sp.]|jgi:threonylcarbamoyladenosine tRNA methylthiotransferase MtaB|nr:MiaB/RimO family radical SAM methylthiotransferase [Treponema sp.]